MLIRLPDESFIREVHQIIIEAFDDEAGDLHPEVVSIALERAKQYINYSECNLHDVCAVILDTLANRHPFLDGNKRTALTVTLTVYRLNGIDLDYLHANQDDFVELMLWVVDPQESPTIEAIAGRLYELVNKYAAKGARRALQKAEYSF